jgi:intracellular septation protein
MKILFDLFPVILFFATYKIMTWGQKDVACISEATAHLPWLQQPLLVATSAAIAASLAQIVWVLLIRKIKVDKMLWLSFGTIVTLGGATLYFHDATYIQWKPTVFYWVVAVILAGAHLLMGKNLSKLAMEKAMKLPNRIWKLVNASWMLFFVALGFVNIVALRLLSCDNWVNFKMFGVPVLIFGFAMLQLAAVYKYIEEDKEHN